MDLLFPFKIGGFAESRSFVEGYRGAWFRCKINGMRVGESGHLEYYLEYTDYPGEKKEWIRLYQKNQAYSEQQSSDQIMIRPSFPQWYSKDEVPEQLPKNDVVAIINETWKVGAMVDWSSEGCHWSGKITKLLDQDKVEVELLQPPIGEGERYDANLNDLRPTLDWSLLGGWTVPLSQAEGKSWHVARVIHRKSAESETSNSRKKASSDDRGDNGGDNQNAQLHMFSSNMSLRAPDSPIPEPSSAAKSMSSLNARKDDTLRSMADLQPGSSSKSRAPSDGVPPAVTSSQPGIQIMEHERGMGSSIEQDQYLQKLAEGDDKLKELLERMLSLERRAALLCSFRWASHDASVKTK